MPNHISYNRRHSEPIYIGFDEPQQTRRQSSNLFGTAATFFGVLGLLSTGAAVSTLLTFLRHHDVVHHVPFGVRVLLPFGGILLSLIAVLCAVIGLFKSPRRYAVIGGILGLIPIAGLIGVEKYLDHTRVQWKHRNHHQHQALVTDQQIRKAIDKIVAFRKENNRLPDALEGNRIAVRFKDSWDQELRYEPAKLGFAIRSAGPDQKFETPDDRVTSTKIKTVYTTTRLP